jgi:hypothetical protein
VSCEVDLLAIIKENLPPEVTVAPDDGSKCPRCICHNMDPETLKRQGECYMCTLWRRSDYRAAWSNTPHPNPSPRVQGEGPSLLGKAVSFAKAAVRHAADGLANVSAEEQAARLKVCSGCEHVRPGPSCTLCGCGLAQRALSGG